MSGEIVNRVEKSGLLTIDLDEIKLPNNIFEIDIKKWLFEGLFDCLSDSTKNKNFLKLWGNLQNGDWLFAQKEKNYAFHYALSK